MARKKDYGRLAFYTIIAGIILRFALASAYRISGDACWHMSIARFIGNSHYIPLFENLGRDSVFSRGPVFHIISALSYNLFNLFGAGELGLKMVSPLFGSLTLILFYKFVKKYYDKKTTFLAVLLLAFFPLHMFYSTIAYIDSMLVFLALLSVYLMSERKLILASVTAGVAVLTKFEGLFMIPLLLLILFYQNRHKLKIFIKRAVIFGLVSFAIYSPLLIRNLIYLGNPFWPFLNDFFKGYTVVGREFTFYVSNIFSFSNILNPYLALFGVPNGNPELIFFVKFPFIGFLLAIWAVGTLIFFSILVFGIMRSDKKYAPNAFAASWIGIFVLLLFLIILFTDLPLGRYLISSVPAMALMAAVGMNIILKKKKYEKIVWMIVLLILVGFVFTEITKTVIASRSWQQYDEDFDWIRRNTGKDATVFYVGQCLAYNTNRFTVIHTNRHTGEYLLPEKIEELGESYIWVNQGFKLEPQSVLKKSVLGDVEDKYSLVYENDMTGTKLYKIKD